VERTLASIQREESRSITMKLSKTPRLFGSSTVTVANEVHTSSPGVTTKRDNQSSKSKSQFPKRPLVLFKTKLPYRSSNRINHSFTSHTDAIQQPTTGSDACNKESEKLPNTGKSSPKCSNEWKAEDHRKECMDLEAEEAHQEQLEEDVSTVATQMEPLDRPENGVARPPKSLFCPPREVMIDPHAVPPSPMKDSATLYAEPEQLMESQYHRLGNQNPQAYCLGDPVGDIAMKRQILDAQRLVRLILGKPLSGDQLWLETSTILQAIRAFALMKQELLELRKKHELIDGDPPVILQELGSPLGTVSIEAQTESSNSYFRNEEAPVIPAATPTCETHSTDLTLANKVQSLEQKLAAANDIIRVMKKHPQIETGRGTVEIMPSSDSNELQDEKYQHLRGQYQQLLLEHEQAVEESRRNLDAVIDSVASVPRRVLAEDSIREKLSSFCITVAKHSTQIQMLEIEAIMKREREESKLRLAELEEKLRIQEESHQRQLQQLRSSLEKIPHDDILMKNGDTFTVKDNLGKIDLGKIDDEKISVSTIINKQTQVVLEEEKKIDN
jgi:hypothetical protein